MKTETTANCTTRLAFALFLAVVLYGAVAHGDTAVLIPNDRRISWSPGIPGGIPTNYSQFCDVRLGIPGTNLVAMGNGTNDDTAAIQVALNLCPNNAYVYLPSGTYLVTKTLSVVPRYAYDYVDQVRPIVLRGAGAGKTRIVCSNNTSEILLFSSAMGYASVVKDVTGGATAGSTQLTVSDTTRFGTNAYSYVQVSMDNDTNTIFAANYMTRTVGQIVRCIAKTTNTLTLARPLYSDLYCAPQVGRGFSPVYRCGIEDLTVERTANTGQHNIRFSGAVECWVKNVESIMASKWHIRFEQCANCEVRQSYAHHTWNGGGDSGYGVGLFNRSTDCLVEDNIFRYCRHSIITEYGGQGNVFGYNYSLDPINEGQMGTDFLMIDACHHGGEPRFTLWEGNVVAHIGFDNVLGSSRWNTAFRNAVTRKSIPAVKYGLSAIEIQRNGISNNIVGNVLAEEGQTASGYTWSATVGNSIRRFGYSSSGDTDHSNVDQRVFSTTIYHMNYDYIFKTNWVEVGRDTALPSSLYLTNKPAFFGTSRWPAIGPDLTPARTLIPAESRYLSGNIWQSGAKRPMAPTWREYPAISP